jgi:hypothetical protein
MGKIAVISGCYAKHPHHIGKKADQNSIYTDASPEDPNTG